MLISFSSQMTGITSDIELVMIIFIYSLSIIVMSLVGTEQYSQHSNNAMVDIRFVVSAAISALA